MIRFDFCCKRELVSFLESRVTRMLGIMVRVLANGPGDQRSIQGLVIPKTQKMVLDGSLLDTQPNKIRIKGKWNSV